MTKEQIDALRFAAGSKLTTGGPARCPLCGSTICARAMGSEDPTAGRDCYRAAYTQAKPALDGVTRLLDEREALLDALRGIRAVEIILSAPNVGASFLIADKAIALAEAP